VDQYYYGSNETIYQTGVQYILDTVVQQLNDDPAKTFTYVEMSFFQRWYTEQVRCPHVHMSTCICHLVLVYLSL